MPLVAYPEYQDWFAEKLKSVREMNSLGTIGYEEILHAMLGI